MYCILEVIFFILLNYCVFFFLDVSIIFFNFNFLVLKVIKKEKSNDKRFEKKLLYF